MAEPILIRNATVIDCAGREPLAGMDVVIRDGLFEAVRRTGEPAPEGATVVDGAGRFLMPGLWESHTHMRPVLKDDPEASQTALDASLAEYLARGITSVVDLGGPLAPYSAQRERQRQEGPKGRAQLLFAGPNFTGVNGWPLSMHHNPLCSFEITDARQALDKLRPLLDARPDVIKLIYDGEPGSPEKLPREGMRAIISEAHDRGVRVVVHIHSERDSEEALEAGADGIEHSFLPTPGQEEREAEALTKVFAASGAYLTPTLAAWEQIGRAGDLTYLDELVADGCMSEDERAGFAEAHPRWGEVEFPHHPKPECLERLRAAMRMLPAMHAAGVRFSTGSDVATVASRPSATMREIQLLAHAGVPTRDVLLAATRHSAEKVGLGDTVGTIEPGKQADAILLDGSPLEDLDVVIRPGHLVATLKRGELHAHSSA